MKLLVLLAALFLTSPAWADPPRPAKPIQKLKVIVRTADDFGASTEESVFLSLGPSYEWVLETPGKRPFKNGAIDTFNLAPRGLFLEDVKWIKLRKTRGDDWYLQGIEIWVDGRPYYRNGEINLWFEGEKNEWTAPSFPPQR